MSTVESSNIDKKCFRIWQSKKKMTFVTKTFVTAISLAWNLVVILSLSTITIISHVYSYTYLHDVKSGKTSVSLFNHKIYL